MLPYAGVTMYAPSLALQQVTGINIEVIIIAMGLIVIFYSTVGGIKAVVWTDTLQMGVLIVGYLTMFIGGIVSVGGFSELWTRANDMGRLNFNNFNLDPMQRSTFWTAFTMGFCRVMLPWIGSQSMIQRYSVVERPKDATLVALLNMPMFFVALTILYLTGLILVAYYGACDPLVTGQLSRIDQMIPKMMMETVGFLSGVPGLFMAGIFSASLSSLSSIFNSYATILTRDVVGLVYKCVVHKEMPDRMATLTTKIFTIVYGSVVIALALMMKYVDQTLFHLCLSVTSVTIGPFGGLFFTALIFPWVDWLSTMLAYLVTASVFMWLMLGAMFVGTSYEHLPVYTYGCPVINGTFNHSTTYSLLVESSQSTYDIDADLTHMAPSIPRRSIYDISPFLYFLLSTLLLVVLSLVFSAIRKT